MRIVLCIPRGNCLSSTYRTKKKSAENQLRLWEYFDNQDLWFQLLAAGSDDSPEWFATIINDELSFIEVIRLLSDHALIDTHRCVHA